MESKQDSFENQFLKTCMKMDEEIYEFGKGA